MNCFPILYSRSLGKDYRWMLVPEFFEQRELFLLNEIYNSYDDYKEIPELSKTEIHPTICIHFSTSTVIVQCVKTKYKDKDGRVIYALQGLAITQPDSREFWFSLPWIITNSSKYLNSWQHIDFELADKVSKDSSKKIEIRLSEVTRTTPDVLKSVATKEMPKLIDEHTEVSYSTRGFTELLSYLMSPKVPAINFAFGISKTLLTKLDVFQIVGFIKSESQIRLATPDKVGKDEILITKRSFPERTKHLATIETCSISLTTCKIREFPRIWGTDKVCLEAKLDSKVYSNILIRIPLSYHANQLDLIRRSPTLEAQKALDDLRLELRQKGWKEVSKQKENWWDGMFQRQSQTNYIRN